MCNEKKGGIFTEVREKERTGNQTTSSCIHKERERETEKARKRNWRLVFLLYMVSKAESKIDTLLERKSLKRRRERENKRKLSTSVRTYVCCIQSN